MRKIVLAFILLYFFCPCLLKAGSAELWQQGNNYYEHKEYQKAASCYEQIAAERPQNAVVYFNLGNAYYRLNKVAPAILNYERALKIEPAYKEAQENLTMTQSRITGFIPASEDIFFVAWWQNITHPNKSGPWAIAAFVAFTLIFTFFILRYLKPEYFRKVPRQLVGVFIFLFFCFLIPAFRAAINKQRHLAAVVMMADAPLMNAERKGKPLLLLPEGTTVKIRAENGKWAEVSLPDGRTGWIDMGLIDRI